ncbi:MAG: membrane protein of unknown function [Promethearchaeota archaeon]|nr:MAG: membrane protein of unknown function [Candidatus Lokiarchaeota archaeon]
MDILNIFKVVTSIITVVLAFTVGVIELKKNPKYWLNRWFFLYFAAISLGFLFYTIYHLILSTPLPIIPLMITAQILYHVGLVSVLMTVFILEHSEAVAMSYKYLLIILGLFILSIFGYFIWIPSLNMERFEQGIIDTETPLFWYIYVSLWRILISIYVLYKFWNISKKFEGKERIRVIWFFAGSIINIGGIFLNMIGGIFSSLLLEIIGLALFNVGTLVILKGFLVK